VSLADLSRPTPALTIADLPEDGRLRHELIDGSMIVTPSPDLQHQALVMEYVAALRAVTPADLTVLASVNVIESDVTLVIPDVAIVDIQGATADGLGVTPGAVRLIVEVTSPSTRRHDLKTKRDLYESWAVPYIVVDRRTVPFTVSVFGDVPSYIRDVHFRDA
jgi:Uma2 family endonuclease